MSRRTGGCPAGRARRQALALSSSADDRTNTPASVSTCAVLPGADVDGPARTGVNETMTETSEDRLRTGSSGSSVAATGHFAARRHGVEALRPPGDNGQPDHPCQVQ